jgi:hypothetical protein
MSFGFFDFPAQATPGIALRGAKERMKKRPESIAA